MKKKNYRSDGRAALVEFLSQNPDCQFTTEELCLAVNGSETEGRSSVYRHLTQLCEDETVRKFRNEARKCAVYQYIGKNCDCGNHFHEKCTRCGRLRHLDCSDSAAFAEHLLLVHGFAVDRGQSILYGLCADCRAAEKGGARDGALS
ncbi:MAG: transcriptional repressor [Clostridia bacterium]|nr:transcriptional repressor [Clostridia bacterium]